MFRRVRCAAIRTSVQGSIAYLPEHGLAIPGKQTALFILQEVIFIGKNKCTRGEANVRRCARASIAEH